jgi:hypothetical protein
VGGNDHLPFDALVGGKSLWDQPAVVTGMKTAMGSLFAERSALLTGPATSVLGATAAGPVKSASAADRVVANSCQQDDCDEHTMTVFFDIAKNRVHVCLHSTTEQKLWFPTSGTPLQVDTDDDSEEVTSLNADLSTVWRELSRTPDGVWIELEEVVADSSPHHFRGFAKLSEVEPAQDFWLVDGKMNGVPRGTCVLSEADREAAPFKLFDKNAHLDGDMRDFH